MTKQATSYTRYQRQVSLDGFGEAGQQKLLQAKLLVVGAGGLGCPTLQYLSAAGVGKIGIVDDDSVAIHNLHRQVLYTTKDVGSLKVNVAAKRLHEMNPEIQVETYAFRLTNQNAINIIDEYDLVIDATDNFATRYVINDACVLLNKPLVYGAISQYEGQVAIFNAGAESVNYRDLFPQPPQPGGILNCAEAGVLGVLPGMIGTMQATEIIKLITGIGIPLTNKLFTYNALTNESFVFDLTQQAGTAALIPKNVIEFEQVDYDWLCEGSFSHIEEISAAAFNSFFQQKNTIVIDVREEAEQPVVNSFSHKKIPLSLLKKDMPAIAEDTVVLFCQSGKRSREAAKILSDTFGKTKKIYSLKGGILNWQESGKKA